MVDRSFCKHYPLCGGCSLQEYAYEEQLKRKEQLLKNIFSHAVPFSPSPMPFGYRSRMDFMIRPEGVGLRAKGSQRFVPITRCLLLSNRANVAFAEVCAQILSSGLPAYNPEKRTGLLKYLTLRTTKNGTLMIVLVTGKPTKKQESAIIDLCASITCSESVVWSVHDKIFDSAEGEVKQTWGANHLLEHFGDYSFIVSPTSFFQSNPHVAQIMFQKISDEVFGETLDLYCGVGVISLCVSKRATSVIGVEMNKDAVVCATKNALHNERANVSFVADDVFDYLKYAVIEKKVFSTVIVDPPRTGLGKVAPLLPKIGPKKIIYMSCNPRTLRDDLELLKPYKLKSLEGFDMFPQTDHIECLAILEK